MCAADFEDEIAKLDPEVSEIYYKAKNELVNAQDSRGEGFSAAARIVRSFWKRFGKTKHNTTGPTGKK
jgi:hypothetical protein